MNPQHSKTFETIGVLCGLMANNTHNIENISVILTYQEQHFRISDYAEELIARYINYDFVSMFRITHDTLHTLLRNIECGKIHKDYVEGNSLL